MKVVRAAVVMLVLQGCVGAIGEPTADLDPRPTGPQHIPESTEPDVPWAPAALLTSEQYKNAVFDLLGAELGTTLPAENRADLYADNALEHVATELSEETRMGLAQALVAGLNEEELTTRIGCTECNAETIAPFLRRAFRTNVSVEERTALASLISSSDSQESGLRLFLEVVLLSPQFLYRFEGPKDAADSDGLNEVDDFALAARLSFFLWNTIPDETLLDLAEAGELGKEGVLEAQVERMLEDERSEQAVSTFFEQWLELGELDSLVKVGPELVAFEDAGPSWRRSVEAFVQQGFDRGLTELLTSSDLPLSGDLADLYGFEPEGDLEVYAFDSNRRAGLLTHPGLMAKLAYSDQDSPIARGVFVMRRFLCSEPPAPPDNVDLTPPTVDPESSTRERFETLTGVQPCVACHSTFNPLGFLFSNYDAAGRFMESSSSGRPIDAVATVVGVSSEVDGNYENAVELAGALADSEQVQNCLTDHWLRYGLGRPVTEQDHHSIAEARAAFRESNGDFRALLTAIATGPGFRLVREEGEL